MISENNDFSKQNRKFNIFLESPIPVNNFLDQNQWILWGNIWFFVVQYRFATDNRQNGIVRFLSGDLLKRCVVAKFWLSFLSPKYNILISPPWTAVMGTLKAKQFAYKSYYFFYIYNHVFTYMLGKPEAKKSESWWG